MKTHKDLEVYQKSMNFVFHIYKLTDKFPKEELFGLTSQLRRAAVSIPSNISEGAARRNTKEFIQFLYHSLGSASEIETQIEISKRLNYIENIEDTNNELKSIIRMLTALIKSLNKT
ncbi:MAG: four helix bundle protein [Bacteroidetes bacterium]|nr:four helix bundle protein [Bacteroidota bacterium]